MRDKLKRAHRMYLILLTVLAVTTGGFSVNVDPLLAAPSATISVTSLLDNEADGCGVGACTLREAIADASSGDTIDFPGLSGTITLQSGALVIDKSLSIVGPGPNASAITIDAAGNSRVFEIYNNSSAINVNLSLLSITGGASNSTGGGILFGFDPTSTNSDGNDSLTLDQVDVNGNSALQGGGIYSAGTLAITRSVIRANTATSDGGGIMSSCDASILNSTVTGNTADSTGFFNGVGGGLIDGGPVTGASGSPVCTTRTISIDFSTFDSNATGGGETPGGGAIYSGDAGTTMTVRNSILANSLNLSTVGPLDDCAGSSITSLGHNLIQTNATCILGPGDITGSTPDIGGLALNGGTTQNLAPTSAASNVVDKIASGASGCGTINEDQRIYVRPVVGSTGAAGGSCDIGAVEYASTSLPVTLGYFLAQRTGDQVNFVWQTATETGNAGFNLLAVQGDSLTTLNAELIPSKVIDSVSPTDYAFATTTDANKFYIQEVAIDGALDQLGPFDLDIEYGFLTATALDEGFYIYLPVMVR